MKKLLLIATLSLFVTTLDAQLLRIQEVDQAGHIRTLGDRRQAVDINSQLEIKIHKDSLFSAVDYKLAQEGSEAVDSLIKTLKVYRRLIERMNTTIDAYEKVFKAPGKPSLDDLKKALKDRADAVFEIMALFPEESEFNTRFNTALEEDEGNKGSNEDFRILIRVLSDEMQTADNTLAELRKAAGFYFKLAAWSATDRGITPIHLDGFDDIRPGQFYEYERNQLYLTKKQLKEMDDLTAYFEKTDKGKTFEKLSSVVVRILEKAVDVEGLTAQVKQTLDMVKNLDTPALGLRDSVVSRLNKVKSEWTSLTQDIEGLKDKYTAAGGVSGATTKTGVLRGFAADVSEVQAKLNDVSSFAKDITSMVGIDSLIGDGVKVVDNVKQLAKDFSNAANNLVDYSRDAAHMALYGRKINTAAFKVSKKVRKLGIDQVPNSTMLDLNFTGKRKPGDVIVLKALLYKGTDKEPFMTEIRDFPMMNALAHVQMTVAYTFAKPLERDDNFKGGPLVSILYKFPSHNLGYRNFFDFGIGLHAASYDFNNDDTPEFAGGIVTSYFKDYLQLGLGYNFNDKASYWFAGLRIPIANSPVSNIGQ